MRDKVLQPLKNEIMKIQVQHEIAASAIHDKTESLYNRRREKMLDFKLVFRKEVSNSQSIDMHSPMNRFNAG
jgi:hypothetical protein